jgi:hypothetical protein
VGRELNSRAASIAFNTSSRGSGAAFGCCSRLPEVAARLAEQSQSRVPSTRRATRILRIIPSKAAERECAQVRLGCAGARGRPAHPGGAQSRG